MEFKLNVKDKSVFHFFYENLIGFRPNERQSAREEENPYYYMKDEIFLKKEIGIEIGGNVIFELKDSSNMSRKDLKNIYNYRVEAYDDVSVKLVLEGFKIEVI